MPRKSSTGQAVMTEILPPSPAQRAIASAKARAKPAHVPPPKRKTPSGAEIVAMGERFAQHAEAIRALLRDVQQLVEEGWPMADPDLEGNSCEILRNLLHVVEIQATADEMILSNTTLVSLLADITTLHDDMVPGTEQGAWAHEIFAAEPPPKKSSKRSKAN
jgi:hypothetical protein